MNEILTLLIKDDIHLTRLIRTLYKLDVDMNDYLSNNSSVIFILMGIDEVPENEAFLAAYLRKIEAAGKSKKTKEKDVAAIIEWLKVIGENTMLKIPA